MEPIHVLSGEERRELHAVLVSVSKNPYADYPSFADAIQDLIDQLPELINVIAFGIGNGSRVFPIVTDYQSGCHHRQRTGHVQRLRGEVSAHYDSECDQHVHVISVYFVNHFRADEPKQ